MMSDTCLEAEKRLLWYYAGKGTTFYSWLDVPPTATLTEINKAYRKKSVQLQSDLSTAGFQKMANGTIVLIRIRVSKASKNGLQDWVLSSIH